MLSISFQHVKDIFLPLSSGFCGCYWEASCYSNLSFLWNNVFPLWMLLRFSLCLLCSTIAVWCLWMCAWPLYWTLLINISNRFWLVEKSDMHLDNSDEVCLSKKKKKKQMEVSTVRIHSRKRQKYKLLDFNFHKGVHCCRWQFLNEWGSH